MSELAILENLERVTASTFRKEFKTFLNKVGTAKERIVIQRSSKDEAALVPVEYLDFLEKIVEKLEDKIDIVLAEQALASTKKAIPINDAIKILDLE